MSINELAKKAAGNWKNFESFHWFDRPKDADDWTVVYTHNRDSRLLVQSNAKAIDKALKPFLNKADPHVIPQNHTHWACGWVEGYAIRVYRRGKITAAFKRWCELQAKLDDYPILDAADYSEMEYEATLDNIGDAAWKLKKVWQLPKDWVGEVYSWLSNNDEQAIENCDDQGGYPTEEQLVAAFIALGYSKTQGE